MLAVVELIMAIVISWPSALVLAAASDARNGWVVLIAAAGIIISLGLFWDAASDARSARGVFDGGYCGSGPMQWEC